MERDGLLKKADSITPHFYHLSSFKKAYNIFNYQHEKIAGDIYVSLREFLQYWDAKEQPDFLSVGLKPDRLSVINSVAIFWEIDRSTMVRAKITEKIEKYLRYARKNNRQFIVVLACSDRRAKSLLAHLKEFKNRQVWFYTVDYRELIKNPAGQIFNSPTGERVTLLLPPVSR